MGIVMYDTVTVDTVPSNPPAVAGYVGGNWPTYEPLVQAFPRAFHLSIAVWASQDAECCDCESGDLSVYEVPAWVERAMVRGVQRPVVYTSASQMGAVLAALAGSGIHRDAVRLWSAHYNGREHFCGAGCGYAWGSWDADGTQWTDVALGRNLDQSIVRDNFFAKPPAPDTRHYLWFPTGPFLLFGHRLNERALVKEYDKLREHGIRNRKALAPIRKELRWLAGRVYEVAHRSSPPAWADGRKLGWRFQQLIKRAEGQRLNVDFYS